MREPTAAFFVGVFVTLAALIFFDATPKAKSKEIRDDAVANGVGEYVATKDGKVEFKWKKP